MNFAPISCFDMETCIYVLVKVRNKQFMNLFDSVFFGLLFNSQKWLKM